MDKRNYERKSKRLIVNCSFPGCKADPMTEQNLKRHTLTQHGKNLPQKGQSTVVSCFLKQSGVGVKRDGEGREKLVDPVGQSQVFAEEEEEGDVESDVNKNVRSSASVAGVKSIQPSNEKDNEEDSKGISMKDLKETLKEFENSIKDSVGVAINSALSGKKEEVRKLSVQVKAKTTKDLMNEVRSIRDLTNRFPEIDHHPDATHKELQCLVCLSHFSYSSDEPREFSADEKLSDKFRFLKRNICDHLELLSHCRNIEKEGAKSAVWVKEEKRNKKIGMTLTRIVYHLVKKGRPDTDYTDQVYLASAGGADCGDINHSFNFVRSMLPHLAAAVRARLVKMLGSRLESTGCLPPVNLNADKATHQRWSRHFIGGITVNPGRVQTDIVLYQIFAGI